MRMLATDPVLDALRAAVVDSPGDDGPRHAFAGRLADLGHWTWAHILRGQLHQPFTRLLVPGEVFGLPTAGGVFRRGFLDQLHVAGREPPAVGPILALHPLRELRVPRAGLRVAIHRRRPGWVVSVERRRWWSVTVAAEGWWPDRGGMVEGIDAWLAGVLRTKAARPGPGPGPA